MPRRRRSKGLDIDGILLLDKPTGISSNRALQTCRRLLNANKAGHTGSLDPMASGLLPLCFGQATKTAGMFLDSDKSYEAVFQLGIKTDSGDADGRIVSRSNREISEPQVKECLEQYQGEIMQIPPMFSAIKQQGQPLYKLARKGIETERIPRKVKIYSLVVSEFTGNQLHVFLTCSKGFYVRSLAIDLGDALGCGAHVISLRRTRVGPFELSQSVSLEQLEALDAGDIRRRRLIPADQALPHLPKIDLLEDTVHRFCQGQAVRVSNAPLSGLARLYAPGDRFLGLGKITAAGMVAPKRLFLQPDVTA